MEFDRFSSYLTNPLYLPTAQITRAWVEYIKHLLCYRLYLL